eukprot:jgi/Bigna1/136117/aug1.32_g10825
MVIGIEREKKGTGGGWEKGERRATISFSSEKRRRKKMEWRDGKKGGIVLAENYLHDLAYALLRLLTTMTWVTSIDENVVVEEKEEEDGGDFDSEDEMREEAAGASPAVVVAVVAGDISSGSVPAIWAASSADATDAAADGDEGDGSGSAEEEEEEKEGDDTSDAGGKERELVGE